MLSERFTLLELAEPLDVFGRIEAETVAFATIASGTTGLLIVAFERLGNVVVNDEAHVGFVDTHTESNGCNDDLCLLHEEGVLVFGALLRVHACMIRQGGYVVDAQRLRKVLYGLATQAIDYARLAFHAADEADELFVHLFGLLTHLIIEIGAVERRFEHLCLEYAEVFLYVVLYLRGGSGGEGDYGCLAYTLNDRVDTAVFRTEVVTPLRDTMCLIDGIERYLHLPEEVHVLVLVERFGSKIQKLGLAGEYVFFDGIDFRTRQT